MKLQTLLSIRFNLRMTNISDQALEHIIDFNENMSTKIYLGYVGHLSGKGVPSVCCCCDFVCLLRNKVD